MEREPKIQEVLEAINNFASHVEIRFNKIESQMTNMVTKDYLKDYLDERLSEMVTKDFLDERLANMRGDLIKVMRSQDKKVKEVANILAEKKVFSAKDKERIFKMQPFAEEI